MNVIVDYSRLIISAIIKQIKQEEITPSDFIISIVQPHLSENKYSILFDINNKYLFKPNDDPKKPNIAGYLAKIGMEEMMPIAARKSGNMEPLTGSRATSPRKPLLMVGIAIARVIAETMEPT